MFEVQRAADRGRCALKIEVPELIMSFDVESVGLHGEGYAVAWTVQSRKGEEREIGIAFCHPQEAAGDVDGQAWAMRNVWPHLLYHAERANLCDRPRDVRAAFWDAWKRHRESATLIADCAWPVEARFFAQCIDDDPKEREANGPYPIHELGTLLLCAGLDPIGRFPRIDNELPIHHPLCDARQSARVWRENIEKLADRLNGHA